MLFVKNFLDWFSLKPKLDKSNHQPPLVKERDIFWCHLGENIGTEISGKCEEYTRPIIVLKKLSKYTFLVIPTSTQIKEGSWYISFVFKSKPMIACLHQIRIIDYRRLEDKIGVIPETDFEKIKAGFLQLYS